MAPQAFFFFSSRRRHTRCSRDWSSDVCSSDLSVARTRASGARRSASSSCLNDSRSIATRSKLAREEGRSEEHTSELQSRLHLVCRLLLEKKKDDAALPKKLLALANCKNARAQV